MLKTVDKVKYIAKLLRRSKRIKRRWQHLNYREQSTRSVELREGVVVLKWREGGEGGTECGKIWSTRNPAGGHYEGPFIALHCHMTTAIDSAPFC